MPRSSRAFLVFEVSEVRGMLESCVHWEALVAPLPNHSSRYASRHDIGWKRPCHDRTGADDGVVSHVGHHHRAAADPAPRPDTNQLPLQRLKLHWTVAACTAVRMPTAQYVDHWGEHDIRSEVHKT